MITIPIQKSGIPIYEQIYRHIKNEIQTGNLPSDLRLPSKRGLAVHLGVSVNSVDAAYGQLVSEGYIEPVPRKGYYVCRLYNLFSASGSKAAENFTEEPHAEIKIDFSPGAVGYDAFPFDTWRRLLKKYFEEQKHDIFKPTPVQGDLGLREAISSYLFESRGVNCTAKQVVVSAGTDYLLQTISLLLERDSCIAMENPVYNNAYGIFEGMGHRIEAVAIDEKGISIEPLRNIKHSAVYITPSHQFPLGLSMPIGRRMQLLSLADETDGYIIEDDYDSEFRYNSKPIPALQSIDNNGRVIYIGSFSKSIAPVVRISYMVLPERLADVYKDRISCYSCPVSGFDQKIVTGFITGGYFERHLNKMRKLYRHKRECLEAALRVFGKRVEVIGENAGHHLLLRLLGGLSEREMCSRSLSAGVKVYGISKYFLSETPEEYKSTVLLGYGGLNDGQIGEGVSLLYKAWGN